MKIFFNAAVVSIFDTCVAHADPVQDVSNKLEALRASYTTNREKGGEKLRFVGDVQRTIQFYIRDADQNDWATPSAERLKRLGQVADAIQPYTSFIIDLGNPSKVEQGNQGALNLLYFVRPTTKLKQELLQLANVPNPRGAARAAYDIIFNLGMDTPDVRKEIVKRMSVYQDSDYSRSCIDLCFYWSDSLSLVLVKNGQDTGAAFKSGESISF